MRIYLDLDSRKLMSSPIRALSKLEFKRRDNDKIELQFLRDGTVQELEAGTSARLGIKINAEYDSEFLALTTLTKSGTGTATVYGGELNLNTTAIAAAFADETVNFAGMMEVEWTTGEAVSSSQTLPVTLINDVIRGDEGDPATLPLFYTSITSDFLATQAQAESGTDNLTWMTPLRTKQAIEALTPTPITSYADLTDIPTEFAPSAHTHDISDTSGLQAALDSKQPAGNYAATTHTHALADLTDSGATTGQVATFDGTAWVPQDASGGVTSYNDLTDIPAEFAPAAHTHAIADTTGLQSALAGKQAAGNYASATHTHAASDITSGTFAIARIPTGTTSTTVALGNHTHSGMLTGTGGISTIAVVASMPATPDPNTLYIVTA